jgi:hypothetical protein
LGPRGTAAITRPIVPVPGDCEDGEVGGMKRCWQGKPKYSEKTCPDTILSTTNPTCIPLLTLSSYGHKKQSHTKLFSEIGTISIDCTQLRKTETESGL